MHDRDLMWKYKTKSPGNNASIRWSMGLHPQQLTPSANLKKKIHVCFLINAIAVKGLALLSLKSSHSPSEVRATTLPVCSSSPSCWAGGTPSSPQGCAQHQCLDTQWPTTKEETDMSTACSKPELKTCELKAHEERSEGEKENVSTN